MIETEVFGNTLSKHEQIIRYIKCLNIDARVSVRQIAKEMHVSEGTAYRAIKEAEAQGLVSAIPKVGTVRIQADKERGIEELSLKEICLILEGEVLAGQQNIATVPIRFVIGANSLEILDRYLEKDALLIVGDIVQIQRFAIQKGAHLIIAGAFKAANELISAAEEKGLVIISCPYDTFEAVSILNRALHERLTGKELVRVEDIMVTDVDYLLADSTVADWHKLAQKTGHSRFPIVDANMIVIGMVTAVDVASVEQNASILSIMTKDVLKVGKDSLVSHLSRALLWEGFELIPIVEEGRLIGVVSRQDILQAFQQTQKQPHVGETVDNLVMSGFSLDKWDKGTKISGEITQFMINEYGAASPGILVIIATTAAYITARRQLRLHTVLSSLTIHHLEAVEVGSRVEVYAQIIHLEKKSCTMDVNLYCNGKLMFKGIISSRIVKK